LVDSGTDRQDPPLANVLWRGNWITRTRIVSGLVLFTYAFFHFVNIGLGLISVDWMHAMQDGRQWITRSFVGGVTLYSAFILHIGLALYSLARRRTLRMTYSELLQVSLGLLIPLQLLAHIIYTRYSHTVYDVNVLCGWLLHSKTFFELI
jgi:adenylate cyclase